MVVPKLLPCKVNIIKSITGSKCDALLCIDKQVPEELSNIFKVHRSIDKAFDEELCVLPVLNDAKIGIPVVYSPVGNITEYQDVRRFQRAAAKAIKRAVKSGFKNPALILPSSKGNTFPFVQLCSILGAFYELYVPIQFREDFPSSQEKVQSLSIIADNSQMVEIIQEALMFESAKFIARDIGSGDPERMTPKNVELYIKPIFEGLKVEVIDDSTVLQKEYPLFAAVNRAASTVTRHQGRIIFLEYKPSKPAKKTLMLVGQGVTYDTGGVDIVLEGMVNMSRKKCGAAAVAGFMKVVQEMKPDDIHVIAALCLVRNSVGEESYVSDEIITSRAGVRVRVTYTDAEGRMCMSDVLCRMKELAQNLPNPHLFTVATLTEHAKIVAGSGYSVVMDNSVARKENHGYKLQEIGQELGEPFEITNLRQEDFKYNFSNVYGEDLIQCSGTLDTTIERGLQRPAAFMILASGLNKHGLDSIKPIKYSHLDIAASAGDVPYTPTAAPILTLAKAHLC